MKKLVLATAVSLCAMYSAASASMIGAEVGIQFSSDFTSCSGGTATVGAGAEFPAGCPGFSMVSVDITDTQLIMTHTNPAGWAGGSFTGFVVSILSGPLITSLTFNAGLSTQLVTGLSFNGTTMSFNFSGQPGVGVSYFDIGNRPAEVPLPAALPLLAAGLGGLGFAGWRRKRAAAKAA